MSTKYLESFKGTERVMRRSEWGLIYSAHSFRKELPYLLFLYPSTALPNCPIFSCFPRWCNALNVIGQKQY